MTYEAVRQPESPEIVVLIDEATVALTWFNSFIQIYRDPSYVHMSHVVYIDEANEWTYRSFGIDEAIQRLLRNHWPVHGDYIPHDHVVEAYVRYSRFIDPETPEWLPPVDNSPPEAE